MTESFCGVDGSLHKRLFFSFLFQSHFSFSRFVGGGGVGWAYQEFFFSTEFAMMAF